MKNILLLSWQPNATDTCTWTYEPMDSLVQDGGMLQVYSRFFNQGKQLLQWIFNMSILNMSSQSLCTCRQCTVHGMDGEPRVQSRGSRTHMTIRLMLKLTFTIPY
jgi:hypothetical protein